MIDKSDIIENFIYIDLVRLLFHFNIFININGIFKITVSLKTEICNL